jgi:hypothetical protein
MATARVVATSVLADVLEEVIQVRIESLTSSIIMPAIWVDLSATAL